MDLDEVISAPLVPRGPTPVSRVQGQPGIRNMGQWLEGKCLNPEASDFCVCHGSAELGV